MSNQNDVDEEENAWGVHWKAAFPEASYKHPKSMRPEAIKGLIHRITRSNLERSKPPSKIFLKTTGGPPNGKNLTGVCSIMFDSNDQKSCWDTALAQNPLSADLVGFEPTESHEPNGSIEDIAVVVNDSIIIAAVKAAAAIALEMSEEAEGLTDVVVFKTRTKPATKTIKFYFKGEDTSAFWSTPVAIVAKEFIPIFVIPRPNMEKHYCKATAFPPSLASQLGGEMLKEAMETSGYAPHLDYRKVKVVVTPDEEMFECNGVVIDASHPEVIDFLVGGFLVDELCESYGTAFWADIKPYQEEAANASQRYLMTNDQHRAEIAMMSAQMVMNGLSMNGLTVNRAAQAQIGTPSTVRNLEAASATSPQVAESRPGRGKGGKGGRSPQWGGLLAKRARRQEVIRVCALALYQVMLVLVSACPVSCIIHATLAITRTLPPACGPMCTLQLPSNPLQDAATTE